ncbi:helix-turn-helix domain-containing protein [Uliginosibacterium sediminicola]|uniref:Helix-turn-helix domain-containing protein n=1 Tax=Uliginosibacterium sediminicola TaxID=2024550 RepID=A0ABU9YZ73_9RHOO
MFEQCLYFNTTALARLLERAWTQAFAPLGLTPAQAFMLRVVLEKPGLLQRELAAELSIARATATRTLDGLQRLGLIERRNTARDGREFAIHPGEQALAMREPIVAASAEVTKRLRRQLGVAQFEALVGGLHGVRQALGPTE